MIVLQTSAGSDDPLVLLLSDFDLVMATKSHLCGATIAHSQRLVSAGAELDGGHPLW
jgi:hypothetical protein